MNYVRMHKMSESNKERHGGPYDRGTADAYYGRGFQPHFYVGATYNSDMVDSDAMSVSELALYQEGYEDNYAGQKSWA